MTRILYKPVRTKTLYNKSKLTVTCLGGRVYNIRLTTQHGEVVEVTWEAKSYRRAWIAAYGVSASFSTGGYKNLQRWLTDGTIDYD